MEIWNQYGKLRLYTIFFPNLFEKNYSFSDKLLLLINKTEKSIISSPPLI